MDEGTPTGRDLRAAEERYLREQLREIHRLYQKEAQPYIDRLTEIENAKPPVMYLDLAQVEGRVLSMIMEKLPEPEKGEKDV